MKGADMLDNIIVRLVVHYLATFLFFGGLWELLPGIFQEQDMAERIGSDPLSSRQFEQPEPDAGLSQMFVPVSTSLLFSFLFALPVTWVYRWTRPRKKYSQAFAQTLLVVPIAIALVVFLVKDSVALAFSLAGIVAAVRFRTSLNEPMDATYMFIVIGIGLAAGIQYGSVAILASVAFNTVALGVWRMNWGAEPAVMSGFRLVRSAKEGSTGVSFAQAGKDRRQVQAPPRGRGASGAKAGKDPKPYNARLRVHTTQIKGAQEAAVALLPTYATRWEQIGIVKHEEGAAIVEFEVRLKKKTDPAAFTAALEKSAGGHTDKVELERIMDHGQPG